MADDMTDEEYEALDELLTRTTPRLAGKPGGFFTERRERQAQAERVIQVDPQSAQWLRAKADATHQTPTEIIAELIREKAAVTA